MHVKERIASGYVQGSSQSQCKDLPKGESTEFGTSSVLSEPNLQRQPEHPCMFCLSTQVYISRSCPSTSS
jgi:hypothetical protein